MNKLDVEIGQMVEAYTVECEKASVSRNMDEQGRRTKEIVGKHTPLEILGSCYWEGLYYEAKIMSLREAVLELAKASAKPAKVTAPVEVEPPQVDLEAAIEAAPAPKKGRKPKVALA